MRTFIALPILALSAIASAATVDVSFAVTGTSGDYTLDFEVGNNILPDHKLYFFGVQLSARDIVASPPGFDPNQWVNWNPLTNDGAGSNTTYNNVWIDFSDGVAHGEAKSGFQVHVADLSVPTDVKWFAYSAGGTPYTGLDAVRQGTNPLFEGTANPVPEPATMAVLALGLAALKRRRNA